MAWSGDIIRRIIFVRPNMGGADCTLGLECGHEQRAAVPAASMLDVRETICVACSRPHWERAGAIRRSVQFGDVLAKLREFPVP